MITNPSAYSRFKAQSLAEQRFELAEKYRILEALYKEARRLGSFSEGDLLVGLDDDIRLAAALNANLSDPPR
jgi:hypothetical protein